MHKAWHQVLAEGLIEVLVEIQMLAKVLIAVRIEVLVLRKVLLLQKRLLLLLWVEDLLLRE